MQERSWRDRFRVALPLLIFAIALMLRFMGLDWGLPNAQRNQSLHPDEPIVFLYSQEVEPAKLDFTPGFYNYGTLYLTMLKVGSDIAATYAGGAPVTTPAEYWRAFARGHLVGRWMTALMGAGTVLLMFLMLRRWFGDIGALAGSGLIMLSPGHLVHSRFQTVDVPAVFLLACGLFCLSRAISADAKNPARLMALAGMWIGLSAGTKYTGIVALAAVFVAAAFMQQPDRWKWAGLASLAAIVAFVIATPGVLLETGKFLKDFRYEMAHTAEGHGLIFVDTPIGFVYHIGNLLQGLTPLAFFLAFVGLGIGVTRRQPLLVCIFVFAILYFVLIGRAQVAFLRYTFPLYLALAAGLGWLTQHGHHAGQEGKGWGRALVALVIVCLGLEAQQGLTVTGWMVQPDPRDAVAAAVRRDANDQTSVGVVSDPWFYTPSFYPDTAMPRSVPPELREQARLDSVKPRVIQVVEPPKMDWDIRLFDAKPDYITFSSFEAEDLVRLSSKSDLPQVAKDMVDRFKAFDSRLRQEYTLVSPEGLESDPYRGSGVLTHDLAYVRPMVWLWKRKPAP